MADVIKNFNLTPHGKRDLQAIWNYTVRIWSEKQANKYVTELYDRFGWLVGWLVGWLAEQPEIGKRRSDIKEGYYSFLQGSHVIFYTLNGDSINIIGVPHQSMDIIAYFTPN